MDFYNSENGVSQYLELADGFDGRELIAEFRKHIEPGSTVLELGMGPGKDLEILSENFTVTGSDSSPTFLERYAGIDPDADLLNLDATSIETDRNFDAIYTNKVLMHLSDEDLAVSINRQSEVLLDDGIVMHSFWHGDSIEEIAGMTFHYRDEEFLRRVFVDRFSIVEIQRYTEMEDDDYIYVIARVANQRE